MISGAVQHTSGHLSKLRPLAAPPGVPCSIPKVVPPLIGVVPYSPHALGQAVLILRQRLISLQLSLDNDVGRCRNWTGKLTSSSCVQRPMILVDIRC